MLFLIINTWVCELFVFNIHTNKELGNIFRKANKS